MRFCVSSARSRAPETAAFPPCWSGVSVSRLGLDVDGRPDAGLQSFQVRKMAARLQAATSAAPILLRLETRAGHGAGKPRAKQLDELTDTWSFLFWQLGPKESPPSEAQK